MTSLSRADESPQPRPCPACKAAGRGKAICDVEHDPQVIKQFIATGYWPRADASTSTSGRRLRTTRASEIVVRPVLWLWEDRVPLGALTLLAGREGIGKSLLGYSLAADITRGRLKGRRFGKPASVLIVATEDSWSQTIVPRLLAADADLDRIHQVTAVSDSGKDIGVSLPVDLAALEQLAKQEQAAMILLDPLMSRLDAGLDSHKDAEVRQALEPLVALAERTGVALVGLIHVNKSTSSDPLTTIMASRAFAAVARGVLYVAKDPDTPDERLVETVKSNLGRLDLPTLTFTVVGKTVAKTDDGDVVTGQMVWTGETTRTVRDVIGTLGETAEGRTATQEAADWLRDYLTLEGGEAASADIKRTGAKAGHSESAIKRASKLLPVLVSTRKTPTAPRITVWSWDIQSGHSQSGHPGESDLIELIDPTTHPSQSGQSGQSDHAPARLTRLDPQIAESPLVDELPDLSSPRSAYVAAGYEQ